KVFKKYMDSDSWGRSIMAVKVFSGSVVIEFDSGGRGIHKALTYVTESTVIEEYLDDVLVLVQKLESF
ncbi:MAG: hypothetical protein KBD53_08425, partial [Candidatus Omnitrophica bacterium]|nr:hypothetical protein [Candidatus Omnitrophota bacterium]